MMKLTTGTKKDAVMFKHLKMFTITDLYYFFSYLTKIEERKVDIIC